VIAPVRRSGTYISVAADGAERGINAGKVGPDYGFSAPVPVAKKWPVRVNYSIITSADAKTGKR
jgi:hypothetical protein